MTTDTGIAARLWAQKWRVLTYFVVFFAGASLGGVAVWGAHHHDGKHGGSRYEARWIGHSAQGWLGEVLARLRVDMLPVADVLARAQTVAGASPLAIQMASAGEQAAYALSFAANSATNTGATNTDDMLAVRRILVSPFSGEILADETIALAESRRRVRHRAEHMLAFSVPSGGIDLAAAVARAQAEVLGTDPAAGLVLAARAHGHDDADDAGRYYVTIAHVAGVERLVIDPGTGAVIERHSGGRHGRKHHEDDE